MPDANLATSRVGGQPPFRSALVVTARRLCADIDRDFLRRADLSVIRATSSGRRALDILESDPVDLIVLDQGLEDMESLDLLARIRATPELARLPVIFTSPDARREIVLDAVARGCSAFLARPYSTRDFALAMTRARRGLNAKAAHRASLERARLDTRDGRPEKAVKELEKVVARKEDPRDHYRRGCVHLAQSRYDQAIDSFNRAVALDTLYAEAYLGLSRAWKAKGDPDRCRDCLRKAAGAYARMNRYAEARKVFAKALKTHPEAANPLLELGASLVGKSDWKGAALAFAQAEILRPEDGLPHAAMARACMFTANPMHSARNLSRALADRPGSPSERALIKLIMGGDAPGRDPAETVRPGSGRFLSGLPDCLAVLAYTVKAFIQDRPLVPAPAPLDI